MQPQAARTRRNVYGTKCTGTRPAEELAPLHYPPLSSHILATQTTNLIGFEARIDGHPTVRRSCLNRVSSAVDRAPIAWGLLQDRTQRCAAPTVAKGARPVRRWPFESNLATPRRARPRPVRAQPWAFSAIRRRLCSLSGSQSPETPMLTRIGYLLPTREKIMAGEPATEPLLDLAARAERLGFDAIWVGDSLFARPRHDPLTLLAGVAGRVPRIELGTAVLLPALRNPVLLAHQVATLDQVSEGRLILGVGFAPDVADIRASSPPPACRSKSASAA